LTELQPTQRNLSSNGLISKEAETASYKESASSPVARGDWSGLYLWVPYSPEQLEKKHFQWSLQITPRSQKNIEKYVPVQSHVRAGGGRRPPPKRNNNKKQANKNPKSCKSYKNKTYTDLWVLAIYPLPAAIYACLVAQPSLPAQVQSNGNLLPPFDSHSEPPNHLTHLLSLPAAGQFSGAAEWCRGPCHWRLS
jgi:hypothetical protein